MAIDISGWETRLTDEMVARFSASGAWRNLTIADRLKDWASRTPDEIAIVDGDTSLTYAEFYRRSLRLATMFVRQGLHPGDVVSFQLPNWHEAMIINAAAAMAGLVVNPIVPIYRDAEVGFILKDAKARVLFIPETLRSTDYVELIERLRPQLPSLERVVLVRALRDGYDAFDEWMTSEEPGTFDLPAVDPNAVKLVLYTSGTTGVPKGVLHSHNTLGAEIDAFVHHRSLTSADVVFMPSPVTHIAGYLYGMELLLACGMKTIYMERWNAVEAVDLIARHEASFTAAATPFLAELVMELERRGVKLPSMRFFGCGGAPVSPDIVGRAREVMPNCETTRAYGATEAPTISYGVVPGDPMDLAAITDGSIVNHEVRIVDIASGKHLAPEQEGEIVTRGPEVMLGYASPAATAEAFDEEGFFHTGDLGFISHGNYVTVTGRIKDIIIRGGENIAPKEIEDVLHRHPAVREASVVAMPHERLGETPCAFIVLNDGVALEFEEMISFLEQHKVAKQKFPEKLVIAGELPHNAAGKVLKHILKAQLKD
tara:strand:- start:1458 stop:3083 length:1626 start_codon:yes stop_codon:yes gene_type:complete